MRKTFLVTTNWGGSSGWPELWKKFYCNRIGAEISQEEWEALPAHERMIFRRVSPNKFIISGEAELLDYHVKTDTYEKYTWVEVEEEDECRNS